MASTGIPQGTVPVIDDIYHVAEGAVQIDASTARRDMQVTPSINGFNGILNNGTSLKFNISGGTDRIRLDTTALRLQFRFTDGATPAAACDFSTFSPPWNLWATMINNITLKLNNNTVIYNSVNGEFVHALSARMFREYTAETLDGMDNVFFTPISGDNAYVIGSIGGVAMPDGATKRSNNWIGNDSHLRVVTKTIPFSVLFPPAVCAVLKNIQSFQLDITFLNMNRGHWIATAAIENPNVQAGLLEQVKFDKTASVQILGCDIVQDRYTPTAQLTVQQTAQKMPNPENPGASDVERLSFYDVSVQKTQYTNATIQYGSTANLDAVCIMQPCVSDYATTPVINIVNLAVPVVGVNAERRIYTSSGQYFFGGGGATSAIAPSCRLQADLPNTGFMSVHLQYGTMTYPTLPITIRETGGSNDMSLLYHAYLRGIGKASRTDITPAIKFADFRKTMPFIFLRPWGDNAPHLNNTATDLTLRLSGGIAGQIYVVLFQVGMIDIGSDGNLRVFTSKS